MEFVLDHSFGSDRYGGLFDIPSVSQGYMNMEFLLDHSSGSNGYGGLSDIPSASQGYMDMEFLLDHSSGSNGYGGVSDIPSASQRYLYMELFLSLLLHIIGAGWWYSRLQKILVVFFISPDAPLTAPFKDPPGSSMWKLRETQG